MKTIDELPLDWFFRPGVKLDFRYFDDGYIVQPEDVEAELKRIGFDDLARRDSDEAARRCLSAGDLR